jgi:chromosome segregation ATPase
LYFLKKDDTIEFKNEEVFALARKKEKGMFKTSAFGGFKRAEVVGYIFDLAEKHKAEIDELNNRINELTSLNEKLEVQFSEAESVKGELIMENEELKSQLDSSEQKTVEIVSELSDIKTRFDILKRESELLSLKAKQFDDLRMESGEIILAAKTNAKSITDNAKKEAEIIVSHSKEYTRLIEKNLELIKTDAEEIRREMKESFFKLDESLEKISTLSSHKSSSSDAVSSYKLRDFFRAAAEDRELKG